MSRRDHADLRCPRCRMLGELCVCALVPSPPLVTRTRVVLVIHKDEARKPTNTGQLALACLARGETIVRGREGERDAPIGFAPDERAILLYPAADARPLAEVAPAAGPVALVVPDGSWRQAAKVRARVPGLAALPCAVLPPGEPSRYRLRRESVDGGLATLEAIARALGVLDGPAVRAALEAVLDAMVERTLWSRGQLAAHQVTTGLPPGARRDAPRRPPR